MYAFCYLVNDNVIHRAPIGGMFLKGGARMANTELVVADYTTNGRIPSRSSLISFFSRQVFECLRRLVLTGLLVFLVPGSSGQVAYGCLFAFARYG